MTDLIPTPTPATIIATAEASIAAARVEIELELARVKLFWAKWGHPLFGAIIAVVSAIIGHAL